MTVRSRLRHARKALLVLGGAAALVAGTLIAGGAAPAGAATSLPCDIYATAGTPCVAAHSTTRALYAAYNGPLYQVRRASNGATTNIGTLAAGGYANAAAQDSFCAGTTCTITEIFDQSPQHNNLTIGPAGGAGGADVGANATALPVMAGGHKVYGVFVSPGTGYRDDATTGVATGSQPQGAYMVASGTHVNSGCCFDYGNAETNNRDNGNGHMDAVYFGTLCWFAPCNGSGPWVQADLENGLFGGGNGNNPNNAGNKSAFVTALVKNNGTTTYAIKGGNADSGGLTTWYSGSLPTTSGYMPMHAEGAIILGVGGDNSNSSAGSFFEGVMTAGYPTDAADTSVGRLRAGVRRQRGDRNDRGRRQQRQVRGRQQRQRYPRHQGADVGLRRQHGRPELDRQQQRHPHDRRRLHGHHRRQIRQRHPHRIVDLQRRCQPAMAGSERGTREPRHR